MSPWEYTGDPERKALGSEFVCYDKVREFWCGGLCEFLLLERVGFLVGGSDCVVG